MSLAGKVALVTGSSSGLGRAISVELARRGADVALHYFRNQKAAAATQEEVEKLGVRTQRIRAHFKNAEQAGELVSKVKETFGGLDILINSAASTVFGKIMEADAQSWDWTMSISAAAPLWLAQHATPLMEARSGGRIINISSSGSQRARPLYGVLGAAKAALESLTRYLAVELAPKGIIVNAVMPGAVVTSLTDDPHWRFYPNASEIFDRILKNTPLGRFVQPDDVAQVVAFLAGPDAEAIVGQTLVVDGGSSLAF